MWSTFDFNIVFIYILFFTCANILVSTFIARYLLAFLLSVSHTVL
jgi:hypothetical protein